MGTHSPPLNGTAIGRQLLDSLGEACLALDGGLRITYCNPACMALLGLPSAVAGQPLAAALPNFAGSPCELACGRALETRTPQQAHDSLGDRLLDWRVYPAPDGVVALIADATARRQFEDELVQTVLRDRLLLEQLPAIHWTTDVGLRIISSSGAALRHLGVAPGELVGRTLYDYFQTRDPEFFPIRMHLRALEGEPVRYSHAHAGRQFEAILEPLRDHVGRIVGVIGLAHDVTDLHQAMAEQGRLQQQVFQAQKLESLGLLAGGLAHDFNNLLVGMLTAADLLRRDLAPGSEEQALAEIIKKAAERAAGLTRQMLVYAGKGAPARQPVSLNAAVEEGLGLLTVAVPRNVTIVTALDPTLPPTEADLGQLHQVITNLVLNAAEATGTKSGCVRLATGVEAVNGSPTGDGPAPLELRPGEYVYLEVTDEGCGMSADVQARIFDPFFSTKGKGRGLGLSAVQGIVRAHGGGLRAVSTPGAGARLRVLLPASSSGRGPTMEPATATPLPPHGQTVLVIDDEPVVRGVVTQALRHCGLEVLSAAGSREGLELFQAGGDRIGLVLLDLGLAGQDGLQTLAALRAKRPDVRVVLTSGSVPGPSLGQTGLVAPVAFLAKPYTVHALLDVVSRALKGAGPCRVAFGKPGYA